MISNLDEKTSWEFLREQEFGHLGCILESGEPYVVPVNFLCHGEYIYIHSLPGQKLSAMQNNPKVCLQTERVADAGFEWRSVIAFGVFEEIAEKATRTKILFEFYAKFPHFTPVEANFDDQNSLKNVSVFGIRIKRLTGASENY